VSEKEQLIITIEADKKLEFKIKCLKNKTDMTTKLTALIDAYLKEGK